MILNLIYLNKIYYQTFIAQKYAGKYFLDIANNRDLINFPISFSKLKAEMIRATYYKLTYKRYEYQATDDAK